MKKNLIFMYDFIFFFNNSGIFIIFKLLPEKSNKNHKKNAFLPNISVKKTQDLDKILYKSILLDFIERKKTLERIRIACPSLSAAKIRQISEILLFKCRKCINFHSI